MTTSRGWPPTYDFDTLTTQIKDLISTQSIFRIFYSDDTLPDVALCQGDVVQFRSPFPVIDSEGDISTIDGECAQWIIIGNTCDLDRDRHDLEYSHVSPLIELDKDVPASVIDGLRRYNSFKKFYLPPWCDHSHQDSFLILPINVPFTNRAYLILSR